MKNRPAYTLVDYNNIVEQFHRESDRAAAIQAASLVECFTEQLLRPFMKEDSVVEGLFNGYGPLGTFSARSDIAYAFGIIDNVMHRDLEYIRKIRNHFAHNPTEASFDKAPVKDWCAQLSTASLREGEDERIIFLFAVGLTIGGMHNIVLAKENSRR